MSDIRPIGVLDSGIGGLSVVRELVRLMPGERIVYAGDVARYPYGNRPDDVIRASAVLCAEQLRRQDIKMLVVACNIISAVALDEIEKRLQGIPVIGTVLPGARAAVLRTAERKVGVIGGKATIRSAAYSKAVGRIDSSVKVFEAETPLLASLVEEMILDHDITRLAAQFYLYEMIDRGVDCLILGCSYYPLLYEIIQETVGTRVQLLDSALWTAKETQDIITALDICNSSNDGGVENSRFLFTEDPIHAIALTEHLLGRELPHRDILTFLGTGA